MKPFSENAQCMKCGWKDAAAEWHVAFKNREVPCPECILRTCRRCGFSWDEAPLNLLVPTGVEREGT